jgi:hypothetical protein
METTASVFTWLGQNGIGFTAHLHLRMKQRSCYVNQDVARPGLNPTHTWVPVGPARELLPPTEDRNVTQLCWTRQGASLLAECPPHVPTIGCGLTLVGVYVGNLVMAVTFGWVFGYMCLALGVFLTIQWERGRWPWTE